MISAPDVNVEKTEVSRGGLAVIFIVFFGVALLVTIFLLLSLRAGGREFNPGPAPSAAGPHRAANLIVPAPDLRPEKVVDIQVQGLKTSKQNPMGVEQCFEFASPDNRRMTGPLARFSAMLQDPKFRVLTTCQLAIVGQPEIDGSHAEVTVTVYDKDAGVRAFRFELTRQSEPPFQNCWMTDAVFPLELSETNRPNDTAIDSRRFESFSVASIAKNRRGDGARL